MFTKNEVQFEHPAKGPHRCVDCVHFQVKQPKGCEIVSGLIMPGDWCDKFKQGKPMSQMKGKEGTTPTFSKTFGAGLKQVAPNEHVKNGDTIVSSTSGRQVKVGSGNGSLKGREPNECCDCGSGDCPMCN